MSIKYTLCYVPVWLSLAAGLYNIIV